MDNPQLKQGKTIEQGNDAYAAWWKHENAGKAAEGFAHQDPFVMGSDGKGYFNSIIAAGNSTANAQNNPDAWKDVPDYYYQQGKEAFNAQTEAMGAITSNFQDVAAGINKDFTKFLKKQR